ncbi:MAG: hypothetical protein R2932_25545 [Caldilineaceae bacterium]
MHKHWLGALGVRRLMGASRIPEQPPAKTLISTYLVERDSVEAPARYVLFACSLLKSCVWDHMVHLIARQPKV